MKPTSSVASSHLLLCSSHSLVIFIPELLLQNSLDMSLFQSCLNQINVSYYRFDCPVMSNYASFNFMFVVSIGITLIRCDMQRDM
jgi:hypothetical protein